MVDALLRILHPTGGVRWARRAAVTVLTAAVVLASAGSRSVRAEDRGAADEIRIGITAAFSGPNQSLGRSVRRGIEACFARVNAGGGVHGRPLRLVALDDGYVPAEAERNMLRLVDEERVLAVVGNVGTPTARVTLPIALDRGVLLLGAFTGSEILRKRPPDRYVINLRAGYAEETAAMVAGLLEAGIRPDEIAFFTQDDEFGDSGHRGAVAALEAAGFPHADRLAHGRYTRNTLAVEDGVLAILEREIQPRAVILIGAYAPCAKFIRIARQALPQTYFLNVSFVGPEDLVAALDGETERVLFTAAVPPPESALPLCTEFRRDLDAAFPGVAPGFVSLEGYLSARVLVRGLEAAGPDVSRPGLVEAIESHGGLSVEEVGTPVEYGPDDHEGCGDVWIVRRVDGRFEPVEWRTLLDGDDDRVPPAPAADRETRSDR